MRGYTLLDQSQYAVIYGLTAAALLLNVVGTLLGVWEFGDLLWVPALGLLAVVLGLEMHSLRERR